MCRSPVDVATLLSLLAHLLLTLILDLQALVDGRLALLTLDIVSAVLSLTAGPRSLYGQGGRYRPP